MISQIAISTNLSGVIGSDDGLLVHCKADMRRFADFTAMTAMICGTKTAQEMLDAKIKLSFSRPMIVVGKTPMVCGAENSPFLFMVESLKGALELAESLTKDMNISGYTICGGAQLYSDVFKSRTITFDRAYVAVFDYQPSGFVNPKTVASDSEDLIRSICNKMPGALFEREVTAQVSSSLPASSTSTASTSVKTAFALLTGCWFWTNATPVHTGSPARRSLATFCIACATR